MLKSFERYLDMRVVDFQLVKESKYILCGVILIEADLDTSIIPSLVFFRSCVVLL